MDTTTFEFPDYLSSKQKDACSQAVMRLILSFCEATKEAYCDDSNQLTNVHPYNFISILSANFLVQLVHLSMPDEFSIADRLDVVEEFATNVAEMTLHLWKVIETYQASEHSRN